MTNLYLCVVKQIVDLGFQSAMGSVDDGPNMRYVSDRFDLRSTAPLGEATVIATIGGEVGDCT